MKIVWTRLALADLDEIEVFVAADSPGAASRLILDIRSATDLLARHPGAGRPGRVEGTRELVVDGTPYIVPYRAREGRIEVLRVFHAARRWPQRF